MFAKVRVILRAKKERIEKQADGSFKAWIRAVPEKGRANDRLQELFCDYLGVPKSVVRIVSGHASRNKTLEITK
ncbi:MAG: hypothetical protein A2826_01835 [Candidatus Doudnabacteria bacterium RIFCSPHIGHO2_01_FULL_43_23]|uniref:Uncharacterized protein n=1 Tax=Candidatus Doudnabacteria bacterium RIFCSPHIGHO2_01_FULL_43_23 TaxID=1817822 RepID=A0A1F5NVD9_9BACT|nr:MAG: hypothetical protein A2826_01835 [Candidatus Doudnabacteria bacterium RIFCSPHIGHO2_01_FULL_43_23]